LAQKKWKTCQECVGAKKVENLPISPCARKKKYFDKKLSLKKKEGKEKI
jgi:hypothetical protein